MNPNRVDTLTATVDQLQAEVDRLNHELLTIAISGIALGLAVMILTHQLWDR